MKNFNIWKKKIDSSETLDLRKNRTFLGPGNNQYITKRPFVLKKTVANTFYPTVYNPMFAILCIDFCDQIIISNYEFLNIVGNLNKININTHVCEFAIIFTTLASFSKNVDTQYTDTLNSAYPVYGYG